jgi:hypothetical protein
VRFFALLRKTAGLVYEENQLFALAYALPCSFLTSSLKTIACESSVIREAGSSLLLVSIR